MRVVQLTSAHPPFDSRIFHKECRTLAQAGYEVFSVAPYDQDVLVSGVQIVAVRPEASRLRRMTTGVARVYRKARQLDADLYHFHDPELILVGLLLRAQGKPVVYDIHENVPHSLLSRAYLPPWIRRSASWLSERLENSASRHFSGLVTATPAIGSRFRAIHPRTVVINNYPWGDELSLQDPIPWTERVNGVAYIGTMTKVRGIVQMVEAIGLVAESLHASLELAGMVWPDKLHKQLTRLNGWARVQEWGVIDRVGVARLLGKVRVGLVVFHPEPNHIEAQPNKLFEYMSAGIPVIASDFPLWTDLVGETGCGLVVNPLDPCAIAGAIEYMLTHPAEAEEMGRKGREAVETLYNWRSEAEKLLALYASLGLSGEQSLASVCPGIG